VNSESESWGIPKEYLVSLYLASSDGEVQRALSRKVGRVHVCTGLQKRAHGRTVGFWVQALGFIA